MRWVKPTSSTARFHGRTAGRWETRPRTRCRRATAGGSAPTRTSPLDGLSRSATMRRRVVLPQPDGPTSATSSAGATSRSTPSSASVPPKRRETERIEIGTDTPARRLLLDAGEELVRHHLGGWDDAWDALVLLVEGHHAVPDLRVHPEEAVPPGVLAHEQGVLDLPAPGELVRLLDLLGVAGHQLHGLVRVVQDVLHGTGHRPHVATDQVRVLAHDLAGGEDHVGVGRDREVGERDRLPDLAADPGRGVSLGRLL